MIESIEQIFYIEQTDKIIPYTISYGAYYYPRPESWLSVNHCQDGSNIRVSRIKGCPKEKCLKFLN
jgi:hypothetical protein